MTGSTSMNGQIKPNLTDIPELRAIHVGISGFPFGSAAINKCIAVYESLNQHKINFLIINNRAIHKKNIPVPIERNGQINNLQYTYTTSPYKSDSFIRRRISNLRGRVNEFFLLLKLCFGNQIDVMFYYPTNGSFFELIYYRLFSKIFGFPIIAQYVEYRTSFKSESKPHEKVKHFLFDKYFMRFVDGVLPISEYLIDHLKRRGYTKPFIKVPPLTDFNQFRLEKQNNTEENYFLYVGTAAYLEAIEFITKSFDISRQQGYYLHLVVNGSGQQMKVVEDTISKMAKKDHVRLFSNLKYAHLVHKYIHANALLIPLTDSIQDKARFPQKISEYLASGNPIITTNFGEVPFYFFDQKNALVAMQYDVNEYAGKLDFIVNNPEASILIGKNGKETGLKFFDYNSYGAEIKKMIISLQ